MSNRRTQKRASSAWNDKYDIAAGGGGLDWINNFFYNLFSAKRTVVILKISQLLCPPGTLLQV